MLPLLRGVVSGRLRRSLCTAAASIPPWAMVDRGTLMKKSEGSVSFSFARAPAVSYVTIPIFGRAFMSKPPPDGRVYSDMLRSRVLAASAHGFLLLGTLKSRYRAHPLSGLDLPAEVLLKVAPLELLYRKFTRFVCNPVSGQLFRLPEFEEPEEKTLTFADGMAGMGLLTQADGEGLNGPPKRYAAAQLTEVDGGRRLLLRRFSSETGDWDELVLPSPLPPQRRMHLGHEVLDFGGRLWWVDVSWGAVCVDPFSDRPELCPVELPPDSMLPNQQGETEMEQLVQRRHMGVSAGRLRYAEVDPLHIRSFVLDNHQSGRWTLEHQVSVPDLWRNGGNAKATPSIAAIDPLNADALHLSVDQIHVSLDMRKRMIEGSVILDASQLGSGFYLPCLLPSFLWSSTIPGKNKTLDTAKNKTLADVLVRSDKQQAK
ncbi:unnamed protein product [Triticum turgidum subsp. durum]|uniref:DUF1618 domain-containing protein n=1 Tax=Triticum turgidum subsp. durum TaxID=4567 RepID=A0A9R0QEB7_TRITD|nr:unnamed protein product [Triticum turgidum subsp. durum]